jgi:hypothetical protein
VWHYRAREIAKTSPRDRKVELYPRLLLAGSLRHRAI